LPKSSTVLHWHGDTFALPPGATRLALSAGCPEQGFVIPGQCLGLQFHLEVDPGLVKQFVANQGEWPTGRYVQKPEAILSEAASHCERNRALLQGLLDAFVQ
jgi:GMP synthase-like glutamine amidotransferase